MCTSKTNMLYANYTSIFKNINYYNYSNNPREVRKRSQKNKWEIENKSQASRPTPRHSDNSIKCKWSNLNTEKKREFPDFIKQKVPLRVVCQKRPEIQSHQRAGWQPRLDSSWLAWPVGHCFLVSCCNDLPAASPAPSLGFDWSACREKEGTGAGERRGPQEWVWPETGSPEEIIHVNHSVRERRGPDTCAPTERGGPGEGVEAVGWQHSLRQTHQAP